jgi:TolA-binding protein
VPDFSDIPAGELPDFTEIRKSFEKSITKFAKMEKEHKARVHRAEKKLKDSQNEVKELKKSSREIHKQSQEFTQLLSTTTRPPTNDETPSESPKRSPKKNTARRKAKPKPDIDDLDARASSASQQPEFAIGTTKAQRLREVR